MFGENLTTAGLDVNEAVLGEHWRIGTALLEVAVEVRIPCNDFKSVDGPRRPRQHRLGQAVRRARTGPGPTCGCSSEGVLQAGDEIVVEHRPSTGSRCR